jgi:hydrogenase/urease accessory protein HupE
MKRSSLAFATLAALPSVAAAHPGHGIAGGSSSLLHYLAEPMHGIGAVLGIGAVSLLAAWATSRR